MKSRAAHPLSSRLAAVSLGLFLLSSAYAITVGFGPVLTGVQDTPSDGTTNQMRQNINITNTVFLEPGVYRATTWDYNAAADAINGATQPVFPFLTVVNGPANHTVIAFGETIDTEPGIQNVVPFGGTNDFFVIGGEGATVAAGIQNTNTAAVQNSILTDLSFGNTDHANGTDFDEASSVGATLDSFGHGNLQRTYAFSIEVEPVDEPNPSPPELLALSPEDGASEVPTGTDLVMIFDEPVAAGNGNLTIKNLSDASQLVIPIDDPQVTIQGPVVTVDPTGLLAANQEYSVQVAPTAIDDTTGDSFVGISGDEAWSFTTTASDPDAPELISVDPATASIDVPLDSVLRATFGEPVTAGSGDITVRNLTDATERVIPVDDPQVLVSGNALTINLSAALQLAKTYAVHIDGPAVLDLADNAFVGISDDSTWTFTTPIPVSGAASIGPGADITDAIQNDTVDQERLNIDRTFTKLDAGTYSVPDWELNVVMANSGTGEVTPMLLSGPPPSYTILWLGSPFDPEVEGIQNVPETGSFTLEAATDVYAGFFTTNLGSEIIGTDTDNSGTGASLTDHDNAFPTPTAVGQTVDGFSHAGLGRTYAFEINVIQGAQDEQRITEIKYIDGEQPRVEFTFDSLPNRQYKVEASTSMLASGQPGGWIELDDAYDSTGSETSYTDFLNIITGPRVFYRVTLLPPN